MPAKEEMELQEFSWNALRLRLCLPHPEEVMYAYRRQKLADPTTPFPYWTQVWPAALALCRFLIDHPQLTNDKRVVELAAGLGLPSLVAAQYAQCVVCSDYLHDAVEYQQASIRENGLSNVHARLLDWHSLPHPFSTDVVLLSDVNYVAADFAVLEAAIERFVKDGIDVIISTPQRLLAKPFIEKILPWSIQQDEVVIESKPISIYVLRLV